MTKSITAALSALLVSLPFCSVAQAFEGQHHEAVHSAIKAGELTASSSENLMWGVKKYYENTGDKGAADMARSSHKMMGVIADGAKMAGIGHAYSTGEWGHATDEAIELGLEKAICRPEPTGQVLCFFYKGGRVVGQAISKSWSFFDASGRSLNDIVTDTVFELVYTIDDEPRGVVRPSPIRKPNSDVTDRLAEIRSKYLISAAEAVQNGQATSLQVGLDRKAISASADADEASQQHMSSALQKLQSANKAIWNYQQQQLVTRQSAHQRHSSQPEYTGTIVDTPNGVNRTNGIQQASSAPRGAHASRSHSTYGGECSAGGCYSGETLSPP